MPSSLAIIVPILQESEQISRRLNAFQQLPCDELCFVDGGSDDGSVELLRQAGMSVLQTRPGRAWQMNAGAGATKSELLLFLHVDTAIGAESVQRMRKAMSDPRYIGGRFDLRLDDPAPIFRLIETMINLRSRLTGIATGDQAIFVRRDVFHACGAFPTMPLMEDIAFSRELKRHARKEGKRLLLLRDTVTTSARRWRRHGVLRTILLMWYLRLAFYLGAPPERLARLYRNAR